MTFNNTFLVNVYFINENIKLSVGRLAIKNRKIFFEYDTEFIKTGIELSPFKLPLKAGVFNSESYIFEGLFGVFNDSLPDGWGRLLIDRKLISLGLNPNSLSPLDRLCFVGNHGMGALCYEPENSYNTSFHNKNLDEIAQEVLNFQENDDVHFLDDLLTLGGSSCGARPKILLDIKNENWIIKFRSSIDPKDIGAIEYAYHLMATSALLDVPKTKLFASQTSVGYFGVQRFDLVKSKRYHMHTISGLLHADHRQPSLDYEIIMKATAWLTHDAQECEKQFRAAVFNVLSHNRDDHAKNFSFLMSKLNTWQVSPAYDLNFSAGPNGEHSTMVMGEGKNPQRHHLLKLAQIGGIKKTKSIEIIDEVCTAVSQWSYFAKDAGVSSASQKMISNALIKIKDTFFKDIVF